MFTLFIVTVIKLRKHLDVEPCVMPIDVIIHRRKRSSTHNHLAGVH